MEERSKYEKWLRDLEAKKDATPAHVYERVRGDYRSRLDGVMDQLREGKRLQIVQGRGDGFRVGPELDDAAVQAARTTNSIGVLTYLANLIRAGDRTTPYSMITAAGPPYARRRSGSLTRPSEQSSRTPMSPR